MGCAMVMAGAPPPVGGPPPPRPGPRHPSDPAAGSDAVAPGGGWPAGRGGRKRAARPPPRPGGGGHRLLLAGAQLPHWRTNLGAGRNAAQLPQLPGSSETGYGLVAFHATPGRTQATPSHSNEGGTSLVRLIS